MRDVESGTPGPGFPVSVGPGGSVHVWFDGAYHAQAVGGGQRAAGASPSPTQAHVVAYQVPSTTIPKTTSTTTPISKATKSGVCVAKVPAPAGTIFLRTSEPASASAGIASQ